jgi:PLP dependent protein
MSSTTGDLAANLFQVRERIEMAAARSGRRAEEITLIAVSKTHSARRIQELYDVGVRHFGENRIQEWELKRPHLAGLDATWHMIGHVQKNKALRAAHLFDTVDSVDSIALAEKLARARAELDSSEIGARLRVLIEVKLDPEPAKSGIDADAVPRLAEAVMRLPQLELRGLMGVPPYSDDPEGARPYFRRLRELRDATQIQFGPEIFPALSMGMSHDFEIAIEEGATEIRVGTALFGEREPV